LLDDVYSGQAKENLEAGLGSLDSEGLFDLAMEEATANVEPGSGTQRITDPKGFYLDDGKGILPQTTGGLANLAGLDVNQFTSGPGFNQQMVDMIFAARAELDRMGKNPMTGESQGQPQGIPSIPGFKFPDAEAGLPTPPNVYPLPPGVIPPFGRPPFGPPEGDKFERPAPYNYYAQSPQYRFRGVPSLNTNEFNEQLRRLYGVA
jgi:hypothetical protein